MFLAEIRNNLVTKHNLDPLSKAGTMIRDWEQELMKKAKVRSRFKLKYLHERYVGGYLWGHDTDADNLRKKYKHYHGQDAQDVNDMEGYLQMCWDGRFNRNTAVMFFITKWDGDMEVQVIDSTLWNSTTLYAMYEKHRENIVKSAGRSFAKVPTNYYDFYGMASDLHGYMNLFQ